MSSRPEEHARQENAVLRETVTIFSELSGLAIQDGDVASVLHVVANRIGVAAT